MFNSFYNNNSNDENEKLKINEGVKENLLAAAKWGNFLSIIGFIGVGLVALSGLYLLFSSTNYIIENKVKGITYIITAVIYIFPVIYLYNFSYKMKKSILKEDQDLLLESTDYLRKFFQFCAIFLVVVFSLAFLLILLND